MPRTTIAIEDELFREIKKRAAEEMVPMHVLVNRLLRLALASRGRRAFRLELRTWQAELQPGVDLLDRDSLLEVMEGQESRR